MAVTLEQVDADYWGNRLEVSAELVLKEHTDDPHMEKWVAGLSRRCRDILIDHMKIPEDKRKLNDFRQELFDRRDELMEFMLAERVTAGKRTYAIQEVARTKLTEAERQACWVKQNYDRLALMWRMYLKDPENLELVFHLDRMQRKGFARMILDTMPLEADFEPEDFFDRDTIQDILDEYEEEKGTLRQSYCAAILNDGGNYVLFVKRDGKPDFVSDGRENKHGFEREWIVFEFEPDLRRVFISSVDPKVPPRQAVKIASEFFGEDVVYVNETAATGEDEILKFLAALREEPDELPLVEVVVKNSPLDGAVQLKLSEQDNKSLAPALDQFVVKFEELLQDVDDIASIKVHAFNKRIKMLFDSEDVRDGYVVRYADQPLNGKERREFEQMMENTYGIVVLSTEKRHAAA